MGQGDTALWRDMMAYLKRRHAPLCRQWFEELEVAEFDSGVLVIRTANRLQRNYLQSKCIDQFTEAVRNVTGALVVVRFEDGAAGGGNGARRGALSATPTIELHAGHPESSATEHSSGDLNDQLVLIPDYSFENFVTGPNNQLAWAASVAVAQSPGKAYNPLFIHGGVGLGKTHLLQAICQTILHGNPAARICYLSCDSFISDFMSCVQHNKMHEFRRRYRQVELLLIDDIHFLSNRERTQEEFFHTFNDLYQSKRQIVLSCDSPPNEIPQLEDRLVSRFQSGLVATVTQPSYETRVAIVRAKASLRGLRLSDDVVGFIAAKIDTNARELEGAITTIQGHAALQGRPINMDLLHEVFGEPAFVVRQSQVNLQTIIDAVTNYYGVRLSDLQSKRRHKSVTGPRQICMWMARKHTNFSLQEIGGYFGGRDHTTVMHSIRIVEERISGDDNYANQIRQIQQQVGIPQLEPAAV